MKKIAAITFLLLGGFSANAAQEGDKVSTLHEAICALQDTAVLHLLKTRQYTRTELETKDQDGRTALFLAIAPRLTASAQALSLAEQRKRQRRMVQWLQARNASLDVTDNNRVSLLLLLREEENFHFNEVLTLPTIEEEVKQGFPREETKPDGIVVTKSAAIPVPPRAKKSKPREWYEYED